MSCDRILFSAEVLICPGRGFIQPSIAGYQLMLRTFDAPFDFHQPEGGRLQFRQLADSLADRFPTRPLVIHDPVFTYQGMGRSRLDRIAGLDNSQPAIVYLSNVVMHSALLIVGEFDASGLQRPLEYDSVATFLEAPYVRGYAVEQAKASLDETAIVISELARFRGDNGQLLDNGMFHVLERTSDIFVGNVLDYGRYFAHRAVYGDQPFFLPADSGVDLQECARKMDQYALRDYLLDQSIPFATLGDDHMDDDFAVSYGMDCWHCEEERLAFVR